MKSRVPFPNDFKSFLLKNNSQITQSHYLTKQVETGVLLKGNLLRLSKSSPDGLLFGLLTFNACLLVNMEDSNPDQNSNDPNRQGEPCHTLEKKPYCAIQDPK